ncbi:MAG: stage 0 sporulation family protein [Clostridia bacterium]|nr:stage 0 sporulation family protein [Clostridia bacterium]
MIEVVGVRFKKVGKIYYFDGDSAEYKIGEHVIVETSRGIEYGTIAIAKKEVEEEEIVSPLKKIIRKATAEDDEQVKKNIVKQLDAYNICNEKIKKHQLEMKLVDVEYTFDNNKVLFYFTADGRIDFRELVRDLASVFKTRIELRQIGVRDEAKMIGGLGICGRPFCCSTFLGEFDPVSIKMAKEQNLSLNPTKISGTCGRLMCCLKNEQAAYEDLIKKTPNVGSLVRTPDGKGIVSSVSILKGIVSVAVENGVEKEIKDYKTEEIKILKKAMVKDEEKVDMRSLKQLED